MWIICFLLFFLLPLAVAVCAFIPVSHPALARALSEQLTRAAVESGHPDASVKVGTATVVLYRGIDLGDFECRMLDSGMSAEECSIRYSLRDIFKKRIPFEISMRNVQLRRSNALPIVDMPGEISFDHAYAGVLIEGLLKGKPEVVQLGDTGATGEDLSVEGRGTASRGKPLDYLVKITMRGKFDAELRRTIDAELQDALAGMNSAGSGSRQGKPGNTGKSAIDNIIESLLFKSEDDGARSVRFRLMNSWEDPHFFIVTNSGIMIAVKS